VAPGTALAARRLLPGRGGGGAGGARAAAAVRPAPPCQRLRRAVQQRQQQQQLLHPGQRLAAGLRRGAVRQRRAAAGGRQARALHQAACALLAAADQPVGHSRQRTWSSSACHSSTRPPALRAVERPVVVTRAPARRRRTGTTPARRAEPTWTAASRWLARPPARRAGPRFAAEPGAGCSMMFAGRRSAPSAARASGCSCWSSPPAPARRCCRGGPCCASGRCAARPAAFAIERRVQ
jgi:hypothetical protein